MKEFTLGKYITGMWLGPTTKGDYPVYLILEKRGDSVLVMGDVSQHNGAHLFEWGWVKSQEGDLFIHNLRSTTTLSELNPWLSRELGIEIYLDQNYYIFQRLKYRKIGAARRAASMLPS